MTNRLFALVLLLALGACSGGAHLLPASNPRVPQDSVGAVPGDSVGAVPGDSVGAVPGANLACGYSLVADSANCTIAININIPPLSDTSTPGNLLAGLHPSDLQNAYGLPSGNPGGTVAIVDAYDDPLAESDLAVYRDAFGLPACTSLNGCFSKVNQSGGSSSYPAANAGWDEEISLDLDMVSAVCPNCKILLVEANSNLLSDLTAAENTAAKLGAVAISNSYYAPETSDESQFDASYNHPGIAVTASSGDESAPFYPAASPYVTSIGGTTLSGSAGSWSESPWSYGGQGCSLYETKPDWQGNNYCQGKRSTVDMAVVADPQTGVTMYDSAAGGYLVAGGTSVGAPIVAAAYALSGNPQGPAYSYAHANAFSAIGSPGYQLATGLGAPSGVGGL